MIESIGSLEGIISNNETIIGDLNTGIEYIEPRTQEKSVAPTTEVQEVVPDETYTGLSKVTVGAIEDEDLVSENIKQGVNILGVEGNFVGAKYKPRYMKKTSEFFRDYTGTELDHETQNLDTEHFTDMYNMFANCSKLVSLDISGWNTKNVTGMISMFSGCAVLKTLDLRNFDTSNVTSMNSMFSTCYALTTLDLSSFDTSNVTSMNSMFFACSKLQYLDIRNFTFEKVTNTIMMFTSVPKNCLIIVKGQTEKDWVLNVRSDLTNVKTVEEYEAM